MGWQLTRRRAIAFLGVPLFARGLLAAGAAGPVCLTMIFQNSRDFRFDSARYREAHLPLLRSTYGDSLERIELRTAPRPERDSPMPPSPIAADISMWIRDLPAFAAATQKGGAEVNADFARVTKALPVLQYDQVIGEAGQPRDAVGMGVEGQGLYYANGDGASWDAEFYLGTYLPRMLAAYGEDALRRVEVRKGIGAQGGGKPAFINSVHVYANNNRTFAMAGMRAGKDLMADAAKITSIMPLFASLRVQAVG